MAPTNKNLSFKIQAITPPIQHGEGPIWHGETGTFYWVDTFTATIYRLLSNGEIQSHKMEGRNSVGYIASVKDQNDTFLVFADRMVYTMKWPTDKRKVTKLEQIMEIETDKPKNQFNDGSVDCLGRVWGGTLTRNEDLSVQPNGGSLYLFNYEFSKAEPKITNTSISNGLDWNKNHDEFFYVDSHTRDLVQYSFNKDTGVISNPKTIFDLKNYTHLDGICDGVTMDEEDHLWIALFGGGHIIRLNTKTAEVMAEIRIPVTYVTSVAFGGPNLDILFVTTSRLKLKDEEPSAGSVFAISGLGVKGLPRFDAILNRIK